jgi:hypothetical protein
MVDFCPGRRSVSTGNSIYMIGCTSDRTRSEPQSDFSCGHGRGLCLLSVLAIDNTSRHPGSVRLRGAFSKLPMALELSFRGFGEHMRHGASDARNPQVILER